ncbi:hypothetical protein [Microbacterium sp. Leaf203]|uniref:hypothetical protein n=1 Tax=Microbacterium sp. Leaf203 TaxID=1735677 RepID=UPI0006F4FBD3|nr:hypothetical protein [Microbacterium sp. Leaf203]KQM36853.1 hypothetical protein ASE56_10590 [Microbacterium sp. Leaf203]
MKNKTLLSCGATVAAFALLLTPVGSALAADEVTTEPTATVAVEETLVPDLTVNAEETEAPTSDEAQASDESVPAAQAPEPVVAADAAPAAEAPALTPGDTVDGMTFIGSGTAQTSPGAPLTVFQKFMPEVQSAYISGVATPEGNAAPDEVELDLRSLVGRTVESPNGSWQVLPLRVVEGPTGGFLDRIDWSEFAFDVTALPRTGIASTTTAADGKVRLVPFDANSTYGVTVTLRHIATGVTSAPVTITGNSGMDGASEFAWVGNAPEATYDGGIPMWSAADKAEWRSGHYLTWADPREAIAPTGERTVASSAPRMVSGEAPLGTPAGFGLTDYGNGAQTETPSFRIGALSGEPTKTVSIDLADLGDVVAVALPSAENGTLVLPATGGLWSKDQQFIGIDYNAPSGLTVSVSGTVVTFDFGSAEWMNAAGISGVPVLLADGTRATAEVRTESLPRDIAGGVVERRIPVSTALFISDEEMLAASRLTGLSPSMAEVQAAELPEGVTRVANGFEYQGSAEPRELSFGFTVAETVETGYGPVRPDAAAPGEVRIAVVAGETPVTPDPEPTPGQETPAVVAPPTASVPTAPAKQDVHFQTGDSGPLVASQNVAQTGIDPALLTLGAAGGLGILGLVALSAAILRRRAEG